VVGDESMDLAGLARGLQLLVEAVASSQGERNRLEGGDRVAGGTSGAMMEPG
jgi:hypothetical protein